MPHTLRQTEDETVIQIRPSRTPNIDFDAYQKLYAQSINDPETFWSEQAKILDWFAPWKKVKNARFTGDLSIKWFEGGKLNVSYNCIDRHLPKRAHQTAIIWEGDDPHTDKRITYRQLKDEVCRFANVLKNMGVKKGDVVTIYMPMIPEAAYAMLACARIGAVHSVVFGGFSPEALRGRIEDCQSRFVITADEGLRGGKKVPLKENVDRALLTTKRPNPNLLPEREGQGEGAARVLVVKNIGGNVPFDPARDLWYHDAAKTVSTECECEAMDSEDPLFILYTSGSTGKPKGVQHTTGGYLVYTALTHKLAFDYQDGDIYWCTADVGWVTGHGYILYGPLANGATTLMFEGVPNYPDPSRFWQVVDKHHVTIFYTAPTAIRALMGQGEDFVKRTNRSSLRVLGSVGEPINPEAWRWYFEVVGEKRCPVIDTWWQTETGGFMLFPLPFATPLKPGSATLPFFGVEPVIVDNEGKELHGEAEGNLCFKDSWPGQMRTVRGDHERFKKTYFSQFPGLYFSGDGARRDKDGYYWITGRVDDVLNVSGHRLGTAEVESALVEHPLVAEAAVVGYPHPVKGQGIYCFVDLVAEADSYPSKSTPSLTFPPEGGGNKEDAATSPLPSGERDRERVKTWDDTELKKELIQLVRKEIGPIATPDFIQFAPGLPKTRSGKIMRRILRKIAANELDNLGDTSTLLNPEVVEELIAARLNT